MTQQTAQRPRHPRHRPHPRRPHRPLHPHRHPVTTLPRPYQEASSPDHQTPIRA